MGGEKQTIQGGSLLSSIVDFFFKGLDNILDSAAEYEEEMGVMKQKTTIPLEGEDGKQYSLIIKLSPVRDKEGVFYVEARTDKPGFDVSSINGKAFNLTNRTMNKFNEMVEKLIQDNKLTVRKEDEKQDEQTEDSDQPVELSKEEAEELVENLQKKFNNPPQINIPSTGKFGPEPGVIKVDINLNSDGTKIDISLAAETLINSNAVKVRPLTESYSFAREDYLVKKIKALIEAYMTKNHLEKREVNSNSQVDATLKKVTGSTELELVAINAHCNIRAAMDMLTTVADDPDFIDSFADDEEKSISIIDDCCDEYGIEEIEEVDITPTYNVLFREISYLYSRFTAVRWAIGELEWSKLTPVCSIEWTLSNLLNSAASWVVGHENKYPTPQNPYSDCDYADFSSCEDESGKVSPECLEDMLLEGLDELVLLLDNYYVNLEYDEQNVVANALNEFKRTLTYAR